MSQRSRTKSNTRTREKLARQVQRGFRFRRGRREVIGNEERKQKVTMRN